ncbi:hypothetical protein JCM3775_001395 [Rhodotorula graminis]
MLSRLKRKPPSSGSPGPDSPQSVQLEHDDHAPPPPSSASSPPSSRTSHQQRSYTTPVKGRTQGHLSTDSLSPTRHRAYTSSASPDDHGLLRRPTSRASSFGSAHLDRPSFDSPSTATHAIGEGSLSLHHLAPPPSHPSSSLTTTGAGLTLVVQAPELAAHSASSRDGHDHYDYHLHPDPDDHIETPTSYSDHRTPLASHEPLFDPTATTLGSSTHSQPLPDALSSSSSLSPVHARPRSHTSSEAVLRSAPLAAARHPHNGLDALEAINRGPSSRSGAPAAAAARSGSGSGTGPGTGSGSGTASPPSMSRASSRGAAPAGLGSRPVSRSNSINSQHPHPHPPPPPHQGEPHLAASALRLGSAASGARSYSPARGRKAGSGSSNGGGGGPSAKGGIAGALALSGVSLATPGGARPPGVALGAGLMAAAVAAGAAGAGEGERERAPASPGAGAAAGSPTHVAPPQASARTSLESHIAAAAGAPYHANGGGGAGYESDGAGSSSVYLGHHGDHASAFLSMDHLGDYDDVVSQLGTGYAVASSKRNADFHALFKNVPDDDYLIEDYGCALQREILIQGRLYISEHHLSFYANIFGWVTSLVIPFSEVCSIEKRMTAYVIPNAIQVATMHARHTFASFLSRDTTYDLIGNIWRMIHPVIPLSAALPDALSTSTSRTGHEHESDDESSPVGGGGGLSAATAVSASGVEVSQSNEGVGSRAKRRLKGLRKRGGMGESAQGGKAVVDGGVRSSPGGGGGGAAARASGGAQDRVDGDDDDEGGAAGNKKKKKGGGAATPPHAPTIDTCPTLKNLKEVCMDAQFPGAPEKIYNLMFTSGFMKGFWTENQKLMEIQIGDWAPQASGSNLLARSMSYIKPLNGSIGPRQTKCLITDESAHVDFDDFVCVVTTTRTPDVPSGSAFSVKTRTSMTWAKGNLCRVVVTTGVEWTKSSFIKGIIEKSAIDGQKQYHTDLEKAMRAYIATHRNEFVEEGHDPDDDESDLDSVDGLVATASATAEDGVDASVAAELASVRERTGLLAPLWSALEPVFEHLAHQSPQSLLLGAVVAILVLSNLWTLRTASHDVHPAERARRRVAAGETSSGSGSGALGPLPPAVAPVGVVPAQQDPQDVANAVRDVLHHYFAAQQPQAVRASGALAPTAAPVEFGGDGRGAEHGHVGALARELDALEARVRALKEQLGAMPGGATE